MYVHTCFQTPFCPQTNTISQGVFYFYGGTNVAALILIFLFVPETKQFTLEQLDYVFGIRTRKAHPLPVHPIIALLHKALDFLE